MTTVTPGIDGFRTPRATCLLAPNPSPMTLDGTNTWLIAEPGSSSAVVVDPGPDDEGHLRRVHAAAVAGDRRVAKILLTHGHPDHSAGAARFAALTGAVSSVLIDLVHEAYLGDAEARAFLMRENPAAARAIAARLDAARRQGWWHPRKNDIDASLAPLLAEAT